jgi:TRAP-type mannitol/chloroaromatic compound transport system permease small subunit
MAVQRRDRRSEGDPDVVVSASMDTTVMVAQKKMPRAIRLYVRWMDKVGYVIGVVAMVQAFVLMILLVESSFARLVLGVSHVWSVEMAQFVMSAYYLLGGALSEQDDYHVRMDLWYSRFSLRKKAIIDLFTGPLLLFYLLFLFIGAIESSAWAVANNQVNYSPWAPPMAPIKIIMAVGIGFMFLQTIGGFFRDLARVLGRSVAEETVVVPAEETIGSTRKKRRAMEEEAAVKEGTAQ